MDDINYQLQIYRVEFSEENETTFVKSLEKVTDDLFKDKDEIRRCCRNNICPLEGRIKDAEEDVKRAKEAERRAYQQYQIAKDREDRAKENYEKSMEKANKNLSNMNFEIEMREYKTNIADLRECDKRIDSYQSKTKSALSKAEGYSKDFASGDSNALYRVWQQRIEEVKEAEEILESFKNKLKHVKQALEYLTYCDYERAHYYTALYQHEFHSKRLESFQCIINNYRELINTNPEIKELAKEILNEVDIITKQSIDQYIHLVRERQKCCNNIKNSENGCVNGWYDLGLRFTVLSQDDRTNPRLQRPVMIKIAEYLLEDAENNRISKSEEPDLNEERIYSIGVSSSGFYENFYNNLIDRKKEIISQVDAYFKFSKKNMEKYIKKIEDIINKVCDVLNSKSVKYEKIEKMFYSSFEVFEKENGKIEEFMKDEEKHPIHNYCNILQNLMFNVETDYYSPLNAEIENTVIDPLCFGLKRYQEERELDCKKERRYNVLIEKEILDLESSLLPIERYKQQLILEGYRNQYLSVCPLLLNIMKTCNPENNFDEINEKISKEVIASNERLENLKNELNPITKKGKSIEKQLFQYRDEINKNVTHCNEFDGDIHYGRMIESYKNSIKNINSHINYERKRVTLVNSMINSINLLTKLINNPDGSNFVNLMQDELLEIPPLPIEESENKSKSNIMKRNKSAKVAPIPTTTIVVKSKSRLTVEESKKEIELCESSKSIKDDKPIVQSTGESKDNCDNIENVENIDDEPKGDEVISMSTTGEAKESNVDENNTEEAIPESTSDIPKEANISIPSREKKEIENNEAKKEKSKEEENIIIEVSNAESVYRIIKNLLLWKYEILRLYYSSPIDVLYTDIINNCLYYHPIKDSYYFYRRYDNDIFNTRYQYDYDRLRYGKHGNCNWKLYKNIKKQINNMKSKYKFIFLNIETEKEFIQRFHYTLSNFCKTCQNDCDLIIKNYNIYHKELLRLPKKVKDIGYDKWKLKSFIENLEKNMKKNLFGDSLFSCFSCCIPGICFGYPYAGKKWCDEKVKNEELSREEII